MKELYVHLVLISYAKSRVTYTTKNIIQFRFNLQMSFMSLIRKSFSRIHMGCQFSHSHYTDFKYQITYVEIYS